MPSSERRKKAQTQRDKANKRGTAKNPKPKLRSGHTSYGHTNWMKDAVDKITGNTSEQKAANKKQQATRKKIQKRRTNKRK